MREHYLELLEEIEDLFNEWQEVYRKPPPADEEGRWPFWYVGRIESLGKELDRNKARVFDLLKAANLLNDIGLLIKEVDDEEAE